MNTGNTVEIDPVWITGNEGTSPDDDDAEAKAKKSDLQLPHGDLPGPNVNSDTSEVRSSNDAPLPEDKSLLGHVSEGHSAINLTFVFRDRYTNDDLFKKCLLNPRISIILSAEMA